MFGRLHFFLSTWPTFGKEFVRTCISSCTCMVAPTLEHVSPPPGATMQCLCDFTSPCFFFLLRCIWLHMAEECSSQSSDPSNLMFCILKSSSSLCVWGGGMLPFCTDRMTTTLHWQSPLCLSAVLSSVFTCCKFCFVVFTGPLLNCCLVQQT